MLLDASGLGGGDAGNPRAERELRALAIARKTSAGPQSEKGRKACGILMGVLGSLAKRGDDALGEFAAMLDASAAAPGLDVATRLFGEAPCPVPG